MKNDPYRPFTYEVITEDGEILVIACAGLDISVNNAMIFQAAFDENGEMTDRFLSWVIPNYKSIKLVGVANQPYDVELDKVNVQKDNPIVVFPSKTPIKEDQDIEQFVVKNEIDESDEEMLTQPDDMDVEMFQIN